MKTPKKFNTRPLSHYPYPPSSGHNRQGEPVEPKMEVKEELDLLHMSSHPPFPHYPDQNEPLPYMSPEVPMNYSDHAYYSSSSAHGTPVSSAKKAPPVYKYDEPLNYTQEHTDSDPEEEDDDEDYEYKAEIRKAKRMSRKVPAQAPAAVKEDPLPPARNYKLKSAQEKQSNDYRVRRQRNNESVRKSRQIAKKRAEKAQEDMQKLISENESLKKILCTVQNDLKTAPPSLLAHVPSLMQFSRIQL